MRVLLCFQLTQNVRFDWNMYNFKFNSLSRGQLASLKLEKIFLTLLKILPCYEDFLVTYFLPLLLECCAEIILISFELLNTSELKFSMSCQTFISSPFSHTLTVIFAMFTPPSKMTWKCKKLYYGLRLIFFVCFCLLPP